MEHTREFNKSIKNKELANFKEIGLFTPKSLGMVCICNIHIFNRILFYDINLYWEYKINLPFAGYGPNFLMPNEMPISPYEI